MTDAMENVSIKHRAPVSLMTRVPLMVGNTSGCKLGMHKLSATGASQIIALTAIA
jgi:hypothetical protein